MEWIIAHFVISSEIRSCDYFIYPIDTPLVFPIFYLTDFPKIHTISMQLNLFCHFSGVKMSPYQINSKEQVVSLSGIVFETVCVEYSPGDCFTQIA